MRYSSPARMSGTRSGVTDSMKSSLIMIGVAKPQAPRHSTSITVYFPSAEVWPSSKHPVCFKKASTTFSAPHALHVRWRELEHLGYFGHRVFTHPPSLVLHHPQRGQERRHLGRIARQHLVQLFAARASWRKHRHV